MLSENNPKKHCRCIVAHHVTPCHACRKALEKRASGCKCVIFNKHKNTSTFDLQNNVPG